VSVLLFTLSLAGLIYQFWEYPWGNYLLAISILLITIFILKNIKMTNRIIIIAMLVLSHLIILVERNISFDQWSYGFVKSLPIVALLLFVPLLQIPLRLGGYTKYTQRFAINKLTSPGRYYWVTAMIFFLLAPILNISVYHLYYDIIKNIPLNRKIVILGMQRSFSSVTTWAPYFIAAGIVSTYVPFKLLNFLLPAFFVGVFQLLFNYLLFCIDVRGISDREQFNAPVLKSDSKATKKVLAMALWIIVLMVSIIALDMVLQKGILVVVSIAAIFQALGWSVAMGKTKLFLKALVPYFKERGPRIINESIFFLSVGFFAEILNQSQIGSWIAQSITLLAANTSLYFTMLMIMLFITVLSLLGVHHMIPITAIASTIPAQALGLSVNIYAIMFTFTWSVAAVLSPFSPMTVLLSSTVNANPFEVGPVWNGKAVFILIFVVSILLYGMNMLIY